ncbi:hypothetical protein [Bradyrhizobium sp. Rc2d]|uniref:hypothetical protein n=1 Tax=Bradyrhizobium sp. Rc2d TaxID=1855321 RepID=UPI001FCCC64D|nr:hypothetical protein [Bradyrhizobium sp. Rc2d]
MARIAGTEAADVGPEGLTHPAIDKLAGYRVLVVEDEYFLASDLAEDLKAHGAIVVGPIAELSEANDQVANGGIDVAVLDVDLRGEHPLCLCDRLRPRGVDRPLSKRAVVGKARRAV